MAWVIKVILGEEGGVGGGGGKLRRRPGSSLRNTRASKGGNATIPHGVAEPPLRLPLKAEVVAVAAPAEEKG